MAPNSILHATLLLLFMSINPSLEFDAICFARNHLKAFGYLPADYISLDDAYDEALVSALRTYQTYYRLNVTGRLEPDTLMTMARPRCGVPDFPSTDPVNHIKPWYAFMPGSPTWPPSRRALTYRVRVTPQIVPEVRAALSSAFSKWSAVTKFTFREALTTPYQDLLIGFYSGDHGDGYPFDGPGGVLAHSFPPTYGWFHYDGDEKWSGSPNAQQFDLESVALHEIGHLLGLAHTAVESAVMFSSIRPGAIKRDLQPDDMDGIHALYPQG